MFSRRHLTLKNRLLRSLVFVCFLNFSGVNNGYSQIATAAPVSLPQSVSLTRTAARTCWTLFAPVHLTQPLLGARRLAYLFTGRAESVIRTCLASSLKRMGSAPARPAVSGAEISWTGPGLSELGRQESYLMRESYIKEEKQVWAQSRDGLDLNSIDGSAAWTVEQVQSILQSRDFWIWAPDLSEILSRAVGYRVQARGDGVPLKDPWPARRTLMRAHQGFLFLAERGLP